MEVVGYFFPDIALATSKLFDSAGQCTRSSVRYMCKEPLKGAIILGTITIVACHILRTNSVQKVSSKI